MEKTQKILKRFISLILTFAISFGSYVFPVFAALPEDNETPTVSDVVEAYGVLDTRKQYVIAAIANIDTTVPAKAKAADEVNAYLVELNKVFNNEISGVDTPNTLKVKTTAYNVITVIIDFNDTTNLGITLTNKTMKEQVLKDTYNMLQEYYYQLELMINYLEKTDNYTNAINVAGEKFENVSTYIEKLDKLEITYDKNLYETYAVELIKLMSVNVTDEDMQQVDKLSTDLDTYTSSIKETLRKGLLEKYISFKTELDSTTLISTEIDNMKLYVDNAILELSGTTYDLQVLSGTYPNILSTYNNLVLENEKTTNPEGYIETKIEEINEMLKETFDLNITVEQIKLIESLLNANSGEPTNVEDLVFNMNADALSEKLISGELNYEILDSYIKYVNSPANIKQQVETLKTSLNSYEDVEKVDKAIEEDVFGLNGKYMEELNSIKNESNTDEERLQILSKLALMEDLLEKIKTEILPSTANEETVITPITEKIEELREYYSKSADNNLTSLTINGIEMDVKEETYKVYVGYDVTELKVLFEKSNPNAKVEILNAKDLKVGSNEVIVVVTAENGDVRQYTIEVIRAEASPVVTTTEADDTDEVVVTPLTNNVSNETVEEEHKNTSDSATKYDEEGLSAFTVLLIVAGIALVGYGVYKIFGDKEDKKIEKAFEKPKANQNKPTPSKNTPNKTNNKKKNIKKRK